MTKTSNTVLDSKQSFATEASRAERSDLLEHGETDGQRTHAKKANRYVHEAETQRQHVRVDLPAKVEINGSIYKTENWSTGGVNFYAAANLFKPKHVYPAKLHFEMDSFDIAVPMALEVCHIDEKAKTVGTRFDKMNERQISIMQHLVGAYITGEMTDINGIIHITGRDNMTSPRTLPEKEKPGFIGILKAFLARMIIPIASILLFSYIAISVYEQAFVVSASYAVVVPGDNDLLVEANVAYKDAVRLTKGMRAFIIHEAEDLQIPATITNMDKTSIIVQPDWDDIPENLLSHPVEVKIDTLGWTN